MAEIGSGITPWPQDLMEEYRWLDELLLKKPATEKEFQPSWQANKYLLRGKLYAYIGIHDPSGRPIITLKLEPAFSEMLRSEYEDIIPGYYMSKIHWSTVFLDGAVSRETLSDIAQVSYETIRSTLSKKAQQEL